jgi:hypothetical protein
LLGSRSSALTWTTSDIRVLDSATRAFPVENLVRRREHAITLDDVLVIAPVADDVIDSVAEEFFPPSVIGSCCPDSPTSEFGPGR